MQLKMYLGKVLIESVEMNYEGLHTCHQRQQYQERIARDMVFRHHAKIAFVKTPPKFFVEPAPSKINGQLNHYANIDYQTH